MRALFRFGLCTAGAEAAVDRVMEARWSLAAINPMGLRLRCGAFAASDGAHVPYRLWLPREIRAGILLLHGACDYSGAFDDVAPRLARRGIAVLAIDQRGFGATETRGQWAGHVRMAEDVGDAFAFLRGRLPSGMPLFILGESMGGAVAIVAAAHGIVEADGLILIAPGAIASLYWRQVLGAAVRILRLVLRTRALRFDRISGWDLSPGAAIRLMGDPLVLRTLRTDMLAGLLELSCAVIGEARNVSVPALTVVGNRDDVLRQACVRRLHENLSGEKTWQSIEDGPHLLLDWQRADEVIARTLGWIEQHMAGCAPRQVTASEGVFSGVGGAAARSTNIARRLFQSIWGAT
jgi:alpha-beta hydrolase superfamily lysophospholipase